MRNEIIVTVYCLSYNHETYIRDALESFVSQKTNFKFEVIVHDDASTDGTAGIIREYETKYPEIIKPIYQTENQYSQGVDIYTSYILPMVKGKYIAICEGDDYWLDEYKLQKQVDALELHKDIDICAHAANKVNEKTKEFIDKIRPIMYDGVLPIEDVIKYGGGYVATNSLVYRSSIDRKIPNFRKNLPLDYSLQIHGSLKGGMLYLDDCMSAYRYMSQGSWTATNRKNREKAISFSFKLKDMLESLNRETMYQYNDLIRYRELEDVIPYLCTEEKYTKNFWKTYWNALKMMSFKRALIMVIKVYFPVSVKLYTRYRN